MSADTANWPFVTAANFTASGLAVRPVDLVVIHDPEVLDALTTAEAVANYFKHQVKGDKAHGSSAHFATDRNSVVQCVRAVDVAWAAPNANRRGLHIEVAGKAGQSRQAWLKDPMVLDIAAVVAAECIVAARSTVKHPVLPRRLTPQEIAGGKIGGLCGHLDVTHAFNNEGGHTDPGLNFPWDVFEKKVQWWVPQIKHLHFV